MCEKHPSIIVGSVLNPYVYGIRRIHGRHIAVEGGEEEKVILKSLIKNLKQFGKGAW